MVLLKRNTLISVFVTCWMFVFCYETFRLGYLDKLFKRELPKLPLLFPPAGWLMFYNINNGYGFAQVFGIRKGQSVELDPHDIFETKALGYDNIRRNVLVGVLYRDHVMPFCRYLRRKFPEYDQFAVIYSRYPDLIETPDRVDSQVAYQCQ